MKYVLVTAIICSAFLLTGCFNTFETESFKLHVVEIRSMQFQPAELTINKGDTVLFVNRDIVVHDVTEENSKAWNSSPLPNGGEYIIVPEKTASYFCTIHPVMKGKIAVK